MCGDFKWSSVGFVLETGGSVVICRQTPNYGYDESVFTLKGCSFCKNQSASNGFYPISNYLIWSNSWEGGMQSTKNLDRYLSYLSSPPLQCYCSSLWSPAKHKGLRVGATYECAERTAPNILMLEYVCGGVFGTHTWTWLTDGQADRQWWPILTGRSVGVCGSTNVPALCEESADGNKLKTVQQWD